MWRGWIFLVGCFLGSMPVSMEASVGSELTSTAFERIRGWREDPVKFVLEELKAEPDGWQAEALRAFAAPSRRRIAMKASKGPGKTALLSWCVLNFLSCYGEKGSHPKGAATSITYDNLKDNLWSELAKWMGRSQFLSNAFEWTKERIFARDHPETWFFSARTWPRTGDPRQQSDTLAGMHADYVLFVLDESGGIPDAVMSAAEGGLATGKWCKIIQAGNPTHLEGPLYRACTNERHLWTLIEITGDPDDPHRSQRISEVWAKEQIEKYGRDNPWVQVNVFGKFPPGSLNTLLSAEEISASMKRHLREDDFSFAQKRLGVDVARFGSDRTVLFPRQGLAAFRPVEMRNARSHDIAARIALAKRTWGAELELVDDTGGYGAGVIDALIQAGHAPIPVNFSGKASDPRFLNKRAEMWFAMAEWVKRGGALPADSQLMRELVTPTYTFSNGKFQIEDKEQIKTRLGFSTDMGDALCLTFALAEMPKTSWEAVKSDSPGTLKYDYEPLPLDS